MRVGTQKILMPHLKPHKPNASHNKPNTKKHRINRSKPASKRSHIHIPMSANLALKAAVFADAVWFVGGEVADLEELVEGEEDVEEAKDDDGENDDEFHAADHALD